MSEEIIKVLNYIGEQLGIAIDWSSENVLPQVLDILGRYRILKMIEYVFPIMLCICSIIVLIILWKKSIAAYALCKKEHNQNFWWYYSSYCNEIKMNDVTFGLMLTTIFGGILISFMFDCFANEFLNWMLVPEIKYLELLKGYIS